MGRLRLQARELEEEVLGALMLEKDAYSIISEILKPECFYEKAHEKNLYRYRRSGNQPASGGYTDRHRATKEAQRVGKGRRPVLYFIKERRFFHSSLFLKGTSHRQRNNVLSQPTHGSSQYLQKQRRLARNGSCLFTQNWG